MHIAFNNLNLNSRMRRLQGETRNNNGKTNVIECHPKPMVLYRHEKRRTAPARGRPFRVEKEAVELPRKAGEDMEARRAPPCLSVPRNSSRIDKGWGIRLLALVVKEGIDQGKLDGRCIQTALEMLSKALGLLGDGQAKSNEGIMPEVKAYLEMVTVEPTDPCP